ncbi:MFS transporter [Candidatus Parcubacteria bacterium]|nr:MFS transporter [Candidatus Parcubacteria bacterium]
MKKESDRFLASLAIRGFAFGMITIFVPIYIYQHFNSLSLTFLFFAGIYGLYAILVPTGGRIMMKIGIKKAMLVSHPLFWGFFVCLLFFDSSWLFIPLSIILNVLAMTCFWPAFHTNFSRVSESAKMGKEVGKLNFITAVPGILAPVIGGIIITIFGYPTLFVVVLCVLFSSAIPLLLSEEVHQTYSDSYLKAYKRIFKKENKYYNLAFAANGMETVINAYLWPLFLITISIGYLAIGSIATVALVVSLLFTLYMGRITDRMDKRKLLAIGSVLTSGAWIGKFFVVSPVSAFIAQSFYRLSRTAAGIPYQTFLYEKAESKGHEIDEFIIYRGIVLNGTRTVLLVILAGVAFIIPNINFTFILAAAFSLGFVFISKAPGFKAKK